MTYTPTPADFDALVSLSRGAGIDPSQVLLVLFEESGFNPRNPGPAGANVAGLNQMSSENLEAMGLTRTAWLAMSAAEQLPHVFAFWRNLAQTFHGGTFPSDAGDLLALNFLPGAYKAAGAATDRNAVIAGKTGAYAWAYADNPPLQNAGGVITVNTLASYLAGVSLRGGAPWALLVSGLNAAIARAGGSGGGGGGVITVPPITIVGTPETPPATPGSSVAGARIASAATPLFGWLLLFGALGWALAHANGRLPAPGRA